MSAGAPARTRSLRAESSHPDRAAARARRLTIGAWAALVFNVLPYFELPSVVAVPARLAQIATQGALVVALALALMANPRVRLRPNFFLVLLSVLAVVTLMTSLHSEFFVGSTYRAFRVLGIVVVLWLLTPAWGRREGLLLRAHVLCLGAILASVVLGVAIQPGAAFSYGGRLSGAIWPIPPTQVAHYAAVLLGIVAILWMTGTVAGRAAAVTAVVCGGILLGTHTRTALVALAVALVVAVASLFLGHARARRATGVALAATTVGALVFAPIIVTWLLRGQSSAEAGNLTGRTLVWSQVFSQRRSIVESMFGSGMSNQSFNGLPIDSNWVASYLDFGYFGITVQVVLLLSVLVAAAFRRRSAARAVALFLAVYCVVSSFTEVALSSPSLYLLDVVVAASLVMPIPNRSTA